MADLMKQASKHPKCRGYWSPATPDAPSEFDCDYGSDISCEECKYGGHGGRKDPEAACNQTWRKKP